MAMTQSIANLSNFVWRRQCQRLIYTIMESATNPKYQWWSTICPSPFRRPIRSLCWPLTCTQIPLWISESLMEWAIVLDQVMFLWWQSNEWTGKKNSMKNENAKTPLTTCEIKWLTQKHISPFKCQSKSHVLSYMSHLFIIRDMAKVKSTWTVRIAMLKHVLLWLNALHFQLEYFRRILLE